MSNEYKAKHDLKCLKAICMHGIDRIVVVYLKTSSLRITCDSLVEQTTGNGEIFITFLSVFPASYKATILFQGIIYLSMWILHKF